MATSIVLVHGAFVDTSGWEGVYGLLKKEGHPVGIVQNVSQPKAAAELIVKAAKAVKG
jgi:hypothetical protein